MHAIQNQAAVYKSAILRWTPPISPRSNGSIYTFDFDKYEGNPSVWKEYASASIAGFNAGVDAGIAEGVNQLPVGLRRFSAPKVPLRGAARTADKVGDAARLADKAQDLAQDAASTLDNCPTRRPGLISGNPANQKIPTGVPLKNGNGWKQKWVRMTQKDREAYMEAIADNYDKVLDQGQNLGLQGDDLTQYIFREQEKFRANLYKNFMDNRSY
ncbi:hypothetical protein [Blastopirellula retiformator]